MRLDEHNAISRAVLSDALVRASQLVLIMIGKPQKGWFGSSNMNPLHVVAKSVRMFVLDRKREDFV